MTIIINTDVGRAHAVRPDADRRREPFPRSNTRVRAARNRGNVTYLMRRVWRPCHGIGTRRERTETATYTRTGLRVRVAHEVGRFEYPNP